MKIAFRPHHFLCALCFQGRGYSPAFVLNFSAIMEKLQSNEGDHTSIEISEYTDSICQPCPHRLEKMCASQEKITELDNAHAKALNLVPKQNITWGEAKKAISQNISLETFHRICSRCSWKESGICENALTQFLKNYPPEEN